MHYQYTYRSLYLYGESAHSIQSGFATNNGLFLSISPKLTLIANYRDYQAEYHSFQAQSFGEQNKVVNEQGVYGGVLYHPSRKLEWMTYVDLFKFPWFRYRADAPSHGYDFLTQFSRIWHKKGRLTARYRQKLWQENSIKDRKKDPLLSDVARRQIRLDWTYSLNDTWRVRSRAEINQYHKQFLSQENGYLFFQDLIWSNRDNRFSANARAAYFNTDSYNARIYAYEQDVLYGAGFPVYYGKGFRTYANCHVRFRPKIDLWLRYAISYYPGAEKLGSQLATIYGNKKSDFRVQIRYRW